MLKNLINWIVLSPSFIIVPILTNVQVITSQNLKIVNDNKQYVNKTVVIDAVNQDNLTKTTPTSGSQDLYFKGPNYDTLHRILLTKRDDRGMPETPPGQKVNDYITSRGHKNDWYNHWIRGLSIDVTQYASSKTDFLKKYKAVTFDYFYNYNLWNSWMGWTFSYGKYTPALVNTVTFNLTATNLEQKIFEETDSSHSSNERAKLVFKQEWSGNVLTYNFYLSAWINWKTWSNVDHTAFASFSNDSYSFIAVPSNLSDKTVKVEKIDQESTFTVGSNSEINLTAFEDKIKNKAKQPDIHNSAFKTTNVFVQGYYGTKDIGNIFSIYSILVRWNLGNLDSTLLLNGSNLTRTIHQVFSSGQINFNYKNSLNEKESTSKSALDPIYLGEVLRGTIYLPILYVL